MSAPLLVALLLATNIYLVRAPLRRALGILLGVTLLVPSRLLIPGFPTLYLSVHRLILAVFCLNLALKLVRGRLPGGLGRPSRVHLALLGYLVLTFLVGVVVAGRDRPVIYSLLTWSFVADQFVFFTAVVIAFRALDDPVWIARLLSALLLASALIAVVEHFTGGSYGRWWLHKVQPAEFEGLPLGRRGGQYRVRSATPFALAYPWITLTILPVLVAISSHARRLALKLFPAVVVVTIIWSYSRSAYLGLGLVALILLVGSRFDSKAAKIIGTGVLAGVILVVATGALVHTFTGPNVEGSTAVREERLPVVLEAVAERPLTGLGFTGLAGTGFRTTDSTYLHIYGELGVFGIVGFILLIAILGSAIAPSLRAPPGLKRTLAAGVVAGLVAALTSGAFLDVFTMSIANRCFWVIAGLGLVLAERVGERVPVRAQRMMRRAWIPALGAVVGAIISAATPPVYAATMRFETVPVRAEARQAEFFFQGKELINTACLIMQATVTNLPDSRVECIDLRTNVGLGELRVETRNRTHGRDRVRVLVAHAGAHLSGFRSYIVDESPRSKPTWARTAAVWLGGAGIGAVCVVPFRRRAAA